MVGALELDDLKREYFRAEIFGVPKGHFQADLANGLCPFFRDDVVECGGGGL